MDGGSTDGSVDIIRKYEKHLASWTSGPDGGQARAIATGFGNATGRIIGWLNSDDTLAGGALERVALAVRHAGSPDCVFYGGYELIDVKGQVQEVFFGTPTIGWVARAIGPVICQPGTFFGRDAYFRVGGLDNSLQYGMDKDLWMKFFLAGIKFIAIPRIQAQFRSHSLQKGHSRDWLKKCNDEELAIECRYGMAPEGSTTRLVARQVHRVLRLTMGRMYYTVLFRIMQHRRIRPFTIDYSS